MPETPPDRKTPSVSGILRTLSSRVADTEPNLAEKGRVSTDMLRSVIDCLRFEIFAVDLDGHYLFQNATSRSWWGAPPVTRPEDACANAADRQLWRESSRRAFAGEVVEGEIALTVRGEERFFYNLLAPMSDQGQVRGILGVNVDISQRKRKEIALQKANAALAQDAEHRAAELAQTNNELRAIYQGIADGLLVADVETMRFLRVNAAMCQMLGYTEEELLNLSVSDIHPAEDMPSIIESFQAFAEKTLSVALTRRVLRKDSRVFFADIRSGVFVYNGRPCLIGIFRDVTERVENERILKKERQVLRNLLAASDRQRQVISYDIHDGLAQQLSGAIMQFQAFESLQSTDPEQAQEMHERGVRLLQQALGEARRLISGVSPPLLDDAGVVPAIENLVREVNERGDRQIECHCDVDFGRVEPVLENAIFRIVQESLTNACRYSQSRRIRISLVEESEALKIEVQDWGIGFDVQKVPTGCFGLASIQERARLLGGKVEIQSQPGRGTAVRVQLPLIVRESE